MEIGKAFFKRKENGNIVQLTVFTDGSIDIHEASKWNTLKNFYKYVKIILFNTHEISEENFDDQIDKVLHPMVNQYKEYCERHGIDFMVPEVGKETPTYIQ